MSWEKSQGDVIKTAIHDFEGDQTYTEKRGHNFALTADFDAVNEKDYAGLFITGGRSPEYLRLYPRVIEIVQYFMNNNIPVAAICHGPQILTAANVLKGKKATAYAAVGPDINLAGGTYVEVDADKTVVDGNLVTSPAWPGDAAIVADFVKLMGAKIEIKILLYNKISDYTVWDLVFFVRKTNIDYLNSLLILSNELFLS